MMRVTPFRLTTLQCSQIGFTLVRTFTDAPKNDARLVRRDRRFWTDLNSKQDRNFDQGEEHGAGPGRGLANSSPLRSPPSVSAKSPARAQRPASPGDGRMLQSPSS